MIFRFPIIGIRHHDFKGRLNELYELAPGKRVTMSIEHENPVETDAVICFLGGEHLGYVRTGEDHDRALGVLKSLGRRSVIGKVTDVDRECRIIWMETRSDTAVSVERQAHPAFLDSLRYDGPMIPMPKGMVQLHSMIDTLEMLVEDREPWDEEMETYLDAVMELGWMDISVEFRSQLEHTLHMLTMADDMEGYREAACRLQYFIDFMGSPETRQRQARWLLETARGEEMKRVRMAYGERASEVVRMLPEVFVDMFLNDGEMLMARLWYLRQSGTTVRGILTLIALSIILKEETQEISLTDIPREWIIAWARRRENEKKADVVHQLIADFALERNDDALARQLDEMQRFCRPRHLTEIKKVETMSVEGDLLSDSTKIVKIRE